MEFLSVTAATVGCKYGVFVALLCVTSENQHIKAATAWSFSGWTKLQIRFEPSADAEKEKSEDKKWQDNTDIAGFIM